MSIVRKIALNTGALFLSNGLGNVITLATTLYIARHLGPAFFGEFSFAIALISFFTILTSLGIDTIITREIAKEESKHKEFVNTAIVMKTFFAGFAILGANIVAFLLYPNNVMRLAIAIRSLLLFFSAITATLTAVFQAKLKMIYPAFINFLSKLLFPLLVVSIILTGGGYIQLIIASTLPFIIESMLLWMLSTKQFLKFKLEFSRKIFAYLLKQSWPIAISGIIYILYTRTDMFLLSVFTNSESLGYYSAALNITEPIQFITGSLMFVVFPVLARFYKKNRKGFYRTFGLTIKAVTLIAAPITMVGVTLNDSIIQMVYGSQYMPSSPAFAILSLAAIFLSINIVMGNLLIAVNKQVFVTIVIGVGALLNMILDYILILKMGFTGAAIATVIVIVATTLLLTLFSAKTVRLPGSLLTSGKIIIAIIAGTATLYLLQNQFVIAIIAGALVYVGTLFLTRTFNKEEYKLIKEMVSLKVQAGKW